MGGAFGLGVPPGCRCGLPRCASASVSCMGLTPAGVGCLGVLSLWACWPRELARAGCVMGPGPGPGRARGPGMRPWAGYGLGVP